MGTAQNLSRAKRGIRLCSASLWYIPETNNLSTSLQPKYGQQNHQDVPANQVPFWSPTMRTSSSDDRQELYLPKGYGMEMMTSNNQDHPNRMTSNTDPWSHSSTVRARHAEMSLNAQRRYKLLHRIWVNKVPCVSPGENGPPRMSISFSNIC